MTDNILDMLQDNKHSFKWPSTFIGTHKSKQWSFDFLDNIIEEIFLTFGQFYDHSDTT